MHGESWITPLIVTFGVSVIGWLIRYNLTSLISKLDDLESTFTGVTGELASELRALADELKGINSRVIRLESWRELLEKLERREGPG